MTPSHDTRCLEAQRKEGDDVQSPESLKILTLDTLNLNLRGLLIRALKLIEAEYLKLNGVR